MGEKREAASDKDVYFLYCNSNCYITHVFLYCLQLHIILCRKSEF